VDHKYIADLPELVGEEVTLHGWMYNKRSSGKIWFLILRDGTGYCQCVVVKGNVTDEIFAVEPKLTQESSLSVTGLVKKDDRSVGGYEIEVKSLELHQIAEDYPISPKDHGTAFLMDNRHLWLRSKRQNAILRVRHEILRSCRDYLDDNGFIVSVTFMVNLISCCRVTGVIVPQNIGCF